VDEGLAVDGDFVVGPDVTAGFVSATRSRRRVLPIQLSASRREQSPARAMTCDACAGGGALASARASSVDLAFRFTAIDGARVLWLKGRRGLAHSASGNSSWRLAGLAALLAVIRPRPLRQPETGRFVAAENALCLDVRALTLIADYWRKGNKALIP